MMKIAIAASAALLFASAAVAAPVEMTTEQMDTVVGAAAPANPGGFGKDRAAWIAENSGAEWGAIAQERAGDNGEINQDYMVANGDLPAGVSPGQVE